jgi:hypothetical protein
MANRLLTPKVYANAMLKLLKNNLVMGKLVSTTYKDEFKKVGDTIYVKRPPQFVIRQGKVAQVQDVVTGEQPVKLDYQCGIDLEFDSVEETLSVDELLEDNIMISKASTLAQEIDTNLMIATLEFPNWVGVPGNTIANASDFFKAPERLDDMCVPQALRGAVLTTRDYWKLAGAFTAGILASAGQSVAAKNALEQAQLPMMGGINPYMSQATVNLNTGTRTNGTVTGAGQAVTYLSCADTYEQTLIVGGLGANATVKAGEIFTLGAVFAVNPKTKAKLDYLQQFVNLTDVVADGAGAATLTIANPIIVSGAYQTCDAAPLNNAVVTWLGTASGSFRQSAAFHKSAIQLASAKLVKPRTGEYAYSQDPDTGVSIRYWQTSDGTNDTHLRRWDTLFGVTNVDRRLGTRVSGQ